MQEDADRERESDRPYDRGEWRKKSEKKDRTPRLVLETDRQRGDRNGERQRKRKSERERET